MHRRTKYAISLFFLVLTQGRIALAGDPPLMGIYVASESFQEGWTKMELPTANQQPPEIVYISIDAIVTQDDVENATSSLAMNDQWRISVTLQEEGGRRMREATAAALIDYERTPGKRSAKVEPLDPKSQEASPAAPAQARSRLAIVLQGELLIAPRLHDVIGKQFVIDGQFDKSEAERIAASLKR